MPSISIAERREAEENSPVGQFREPELSRSIIDQIDAPPPRERRQLSGIEGALSAIAAVISVAAVSFAVGLLSAPDGSKVNLNAEMLQRGPFDDFLIPGILLLVFVGGSSAVASVLVLAAHRYAWRASAVTGAIVVTWVTTRLAIMGFGSYFEPLVFAAGVAMIALALRQRIAAAA